MKWTNRTMAAACLLGFVMTPATAVAALALCGIAVWKTRGGHREW